MQKKDLPIRVQQLVDQSLNVLSTVSGSERYVDPGKLAGLRASVLSFIGMAYGKEHSHYSEFDKATNFEYLYNAKKGHEILLSIQNEMEGGWIFSVKQLVSAEIFSDFLEMAGYFLEQGYKDPSAVMIGGVLEENLRQLCRENGVELEFEKGDGSFAPKSADRLNSDLAKGEVYTKLDQKNVTAWLDLRNKAAHGKYDEYTQEQVEIMMRGVTEFLARMSR